MVNVQEINYKDYGRCLRLYNDVVEIVTTLDFGPRIVRYGFIDGVNIFNDKKELFTKSVGQPFKDYYGEDKFFCLYGGHRLWTSPEWYPEMYYPDNDPVAYEVFEEDGKKSVMLTPPAQEKNFIQMKIKLTLDADDSNVEVVHYVTNLGTRIKEFAIWCLSLCSKGGLEIIPMNTNQTGYLPNGKIAVWPYTDLRMDEIYFGKKYTTIKQPDVNRLKLGFHLKDGTVYYVLEDSVFVKNYYPNYETGVYPDGGVSYETYSCANFTEIETLGELKRVAPNETVSHTERWSLCKKPCDFERKDDESIENFISKL